MTAGQSGAGDPLDVETSPSVESALRWSEASVALRGGPAVVGEPDIVLGALLAHPDSEGELRRLIGHFGLTARDVLPDDYPQVTRERLRTAAASVGAVPTPPSRDTEVGAILAAADRFTAGAPTQVVHLIGGLLTVSAGFRERLQRALAPSGVQVSSLTDEYREFLSIVDLNGPVVAGKQLAEWLIQKFPLQPASLATYSSDQVNPEADFVGVSIEADAFAYLLASKALVPPLAVGLFGNWGSGKSFLMAKIKARIEQLTGLPADASSADSVRVWRNITHIEFNAWQYVETNLFAALLHRIFAQIDPEAREKLSQDVTAKITAEIEKQQEEVTGAERELEAARNGEARTADELRLQRKALGDVEASLAVNRDTLIVQSLEADARTVAMRRLSAAGKELLDPNVAHDLDLAIDDASRAAVAVRTGPWLSTKFWTARRIVWLTLAIIAVPIVSFVIERFTSASALTGLLASLAALVPVVAKAMNAAAGVAEAQQKKFKDAADKVDVQVAAAREAARATVGQAEAALAIAQSVVAGAQQKSIGAKERQAELERDRDAQTAGKALADFAAHANADYRAQLGQITKINEDLTDFTNLTREYNRTSAGATGTHNPPNRIILYIDDLDRCPPKKVVEVLEAVHLLLAFELFVVVVAVDTRWLTSSLESGLTSLQPSPTSADSPTAVDYIEKIFQIPFWVEELDDDARARLLRGLLLPSVAGPSDARPGGGTILAVGAREEELVDAMLTGYGPGLAINAAQLSITKDELTFIETLAPLVGGTPRRVKRFVNICKLLLAMAPPLLSEGAMPTERMATCFMAAVHEGMPPVAEHLGRQPPNPTLTLHSALEKIDKIKFADELARINHWLANRQAIQPPPKTFDAAELSRFVVRYDVIRRLRFQSESARGPDGIGQPSA
jgi:hypothetical protein